jgi:hypothetical protein
LSRRIGIMINQLSVIAGGVTPALERSEGSHARGKWR